MHTTIRGHSAAALELIERVMHGTGSVEREYPLVFGENAPGRVVTLEKNADGEGVLSVCAILVRDLVMPGAKLRVGLIGSVVTDPAARGRGLASRVLARAEAALAAEDCLFALLWADDERFYVKRGWCAVGTEVDWLVPFELAGALPSTSDVREARAEDLEALHALYESHPTRVLRSCEETRALLRVPDMRVLVRERAGRPVAYTCEGRGRDFRGVVHEWAGEPADVLSLVHAHLEVLGHDLVLIAPPSTHALARSLGALGCPFLDGVLGMAKLLRPDLAALHIGRLVIDAPSVGDLGATLHIQGPRSRVSLTPLETLAVLLGARGERTATAALEASTGLDLPDLPLAPFLWGLDSI